MSRPTEPSTTLSIAPLLATALCAVVVWTVFSPAIMTNDSIDQYQQAVTGRYHDWHPPIMALILHTVMRVNGSLGILMLLQCLASFLGVWFLTSRIIKRVGVGGHARPWLSLAVLLILLSPLSPLPFFAMTLWKDSWLAILVMLFVAVADCAYEQMDAPKSRFAWLSLSLLTVLSALMFAVRHNAIVLAPVVCVTFWLIGRRRFGRVGAFGMALLPVVLYFILGAGMRTVLVVEPRHPENQVMALDLVGMITRRPDLRADFPYTASQLLAGYKERYRTGDVAPLYWEDPPIVDRAYVRFGANSEMEMEYRHAILSHPWLLATLKAEAWWTLLYWRHTRYWVFGGIVGNRFELSQNRTLQWVRGKLVLMGESIFALRPVKWAMGSHLIWLLMNLVWFLWRTAESVRRPAPSRLFELTLLAIPLAYYLSFAIAAPAPDFRLMYPSTLAVQVLTLAVLAGWVWRQLGRSEK